MSKSVFLIDDDPDESFLFLDAVTEINRNYECFTCTDSQEALQQLVQEKIKPDFIFLDLNMPRLKGNEFLRRIKKMPQLSQIPVIIYTTSKFKNDMEESLESGAFLFLTKPFKRDDLIAAIRKIIE